MDIFKKVSMLTAFLLILLLTGCYHEEDEGTNTGSSCPKTSDNITWQSFGSYELNAEGRDATAWKIIDQCDWHIHKNHDGGYGDTLQVASPGEEVIFVWAYNDFYGFNVTDGWTGKTSRGAELGMHTSTFHGLHTEFTPISETYSEYQSGNTTVRAYFEYGFLVRLYVGYYLRSY